jgi:hypothetical protein
VVHEIETNRWAARWQRIRWSEVIGPLIITLLVIVYYRRLLLGDFPVSHDHPAHLFNGWLTSDVLLPSGRLRGWTDMWFAGYPANELYGPGGNLWITAVRMLTFGQLDYGTTYGLSIFALFLVIPLSVYALGRAFVGKMAGLIAALMIIVTRGGWYDLGWFWILEMGVWPFALGAALTFFALVLLRKTLREGGAGHIALTSMAVSAAVLGHPMSILLLVVCAPILLVHHLVESGKKDASRVLLRLLGVAALTLLLCAVWLVPFIAKSAYTQKLGEVWMRLDEALPALIRLDLFGPEWRFCFVAAIIGTFIAIIRRNVWVLFFATTGVVMTLLASSTLLYELRLFDVASPFASIQYPRFIGVVRVFMYLLAGYTIQELVRAGKGLRQRLRECTSRIQRAKSIAFLLLPVLLITPFIPGSVGYFWANHRAQTSGIQTQHDLLWWDDFRSAADYLKDELRDEPWSRVAAIGDPYDHVFSTLPVYTGAPVYTGGFVPAHTYRFFFEGKRDANTLRAVGVRYVLAHTSWGRKRSDLAHRKTFGVLSVYELKKANPRRASPIGTCSVLETRATNKRLQFLVSDVRGACRLRIHRSDYPNWQADLDGTPLEIERVGIHPGSSYDAFMSVDVPADGTLTLRWVDQPSDRVGWWLGGMGLLMLVGIGLRNRFPRLRAWLSARVPTPSRKTRRRGAVVLWALLLLGLLGSVVVATQRAQEVTYTFDRHLDEAERYVEADGKRIDCVRASLEPGWRCSVNWDLIAAGLYSFDYDNRYCIYAHPSPAGIKHITFRDVPLKKRLSGFYGLLDTSQGIGPVHMDIRIGDADPVRFTVKKPKRAIGFELMTPPGVATVDIAIQADQPDWRQFCFNMQVLDE